MRPDAAAAPGMAGDIEAAVAMAPGPAVAIAWPIKRSIYDKGDPNHVVDQHQPEARKHLSGEGITCASPASFIFLQNALLDELGDVA